MEPKVCLVIVTWNKQADVLNLLDSLTRLDYKNIETVVVDNASTDDTVKSIRQRFPGVTLIENQKNLGGSGGFNSGMRYGLTKDFKYFWLLDNDVIVQPDALKQLIEVAEGNPQFGQIGSKICYLNAPKTIQEIGAKINWRTGEGQPIKTGAPDQNISDTPFEVDYCAACSVLVRAEAAQQAGLMDERFFVFFDDKDFSQKIKANGWQVIAAPASRVWHMFHSEKNIQPWRLYYSIRNSFYFFEKHAQGGKRSRVITRLAVSAVKKYFKYAFRKGILLRKDS